MSKLVIDNLDDDLCARLEMLAREHGRTVADEARDILRRAAAQPIADDQTEGLGTRLARCFAGLGLDFEIPEMRGGEIKPPSFEP